MPAKTMPMAVSSLTRALRVSAPMPIELTTAVTSLDVHDLARLARGEASVSELGAPFQMSLPAVSKHLKVLERAGLIERGRRAQWRPCRLNGEGLRGAFDWVAEYRRFWEHGFDRLDAYLDELQNKDANDERH